MTPAAWLFAWFMFLVSGLMVTSWFAGYMTAKRKYQQVEDEEPIDETFNL